MARIELDIFSGLPNPVWDLNTTETASLIRQIKNDQTEVRPLSESSDRLGYKGFIIHMDSQESYRSGLGANPVAFRLSEGHANPDTLQELHFPMYVAEQVATLQPIARWCTNLQVLDIGNQCSSADNAVIRALARNSWFT